MSQHGVESQDKILIEKQLMTCDIIVLNKTDLSSINLEQVKADMAAVNPEAELIPAVECDIDIEKALRGVPGRFVKEEAGNTTAEYRSFAFKLDPRLIRSKFEEWLKVLPPQVVRLKGFVRFEGENGIFEVQVSRWQRKVTLFPSLRWLDATLVVISHPMPAEKILEGLKDCISKK